MAVDTNGMPPPDVVVALATTADGYDLSIEIRHAWHGVILDCGRRSNGSKFYIELPRGFKTARGARQAAAIMTGERLEWRQPNPVNSVEKT